MGKVDVVLSVYNGARYIKEQLDSIMKQTILPDVIYVIDDSSTDNSIEILEEFIQLYENKIQWHFIKNETNVGWKKNFIHGLNLCKNDYIFLCDQDDIWKRDKIEIMINTMEKNNNINLLACNYDAFSENHSTDSFVKRSKKFLDDGSVTVIMPDEKIVYIQRPGCCYCVRRKFVNEIKAFLKDDLAHDAQLWRYSCISNSLAVINKKLVYYRRHSNNVTKPVKSTLKSRQESINSLYEHFLDLSQYPNISMQGKNSVNNEIDFLRYRLQFLESFSIKRAIVLLKYYKYYVNFWGYLKDFYLSFGK